MLHFLQTITQFFVNFMSREMVLYKNWEWTKRLPVVNRVWLRAKRDMDEYYEFIKAEVDAQIQLFETHPDPSRSSTETETFIHAYLSEMHSTGNPWLRVDQLYCVVSDFWLAGMETTATLLRWAVLYMVEFSEAQRKAQEEIDRVVGRDRFVASEDRARMPYTSALILECERYSVLGTTLFRVCEFYSNWSELESFLNFLKISNLQSLLKYPSTPIQATPSRPSLTTPSLRIRTICSTSTVTTPTTPVPSMTLRSSNRSAIYTRASPHLDSSRRTLPRGSLPSEWASASVRGRGWPGWRCSLY